LADHAKFKGEYSFSCQDKIGAFNAGVFRARARGRW